MTEGISVSYFFRRNTITGCAIGLSCIAACLGCACTLVAFACMLYAYAIVASDWYLPYISRYAFALNTRKSVAAAAATVDTIDLIT
jgi:hypothetical protein